MDTTDYHTQHITRPNNSTKPPKYWWSYTTTWMTIGSDRHIQAQRISISKLTTPKGIVSEPIESSKVRPHHVNDRTITKIRPNVTEIPRTNVKTSTFTGDFNFEFNKISFVVSPTFY